MVGFDEEEKVVWERGRTGGEEKEDLICAEFNRNPRSKGKGRVGDLGEYATKEEGQS